MPEIEDQRPAAEIRQDLLGSPHEGIAPDIPETLPSDAQQLSPEDIGRLTAAAVDKIDDTQLAKALQVVSSEQVASTR